MYYLLRTRLSLVLSVVHQIMALGAIFGKKGCRHVLKIFLSFLVNQKSETLSLLFYEIKGIRLNCENPFRTEVEKVN